MEYGSHAVFTRTTAKCSQMAGAKIGKFVRKETEIQQTQDSLQSPEMLRTQ